MAKKVFIFPGQGSQHVGMGKALFDAHDDVKALYSSASELAGVDIAGISFDGPQYELDADVNAQLAVYTANEAYRISADKMGLVPDAVTGYSLGFYSAVVAAGCLGFADGLMAVKTAGELALKHGGPGSMGAIIGLSQQEVEEICAAASSVGQVWVSNINAARQILVSGSAQGVERAVELALQKGVLAAYRLPMNAAYHSPMMSGAVREFEGYVGGLGFKDPEIPLVSYLEAEYLEDADAVSRTVSGQLARRVLWKDTVLRLVADGFDEFVEVGPGSALSRMVRWVARDVKVTAMESLLDTGSKV